MRAGDLTHRVLIQRGTESRDTFGEPIVSWSDLGQVWAQVEWQHGSESLQGDRRYSDPVATVRVRRSTATMSLREKDRVLVPMGATTLRDAISAAGTSLVLENAAVMPPFADFVVRVGAELMIVSAGAGTVASPYTVTRGAYGTTAVKHAAGVSAIHMAPVDIESVIATPYSMEMRGTRGEVRT